MTTILIRAEDVQEYLSAAGGAAIPITRPLRNQPRGAQTYLGYVWEYRPTKARLFASITPKDADHLQEFDRYAPMQPGDVIPIREPWFLIRRDPSGSVLIRYAEGEERTLTPPEGDEVKTQWPGRWQGARGMYLWMCRLQARIHSAECRKVDGVWSWVYSATIERIAG